MIQTSNTLLNENLFLGATALPRQISAIEVPKGARLLQGESLRNLDNIVRRRLRREMRHLRCILGHPVIDPLAKGRLRPPGMDGGSGDAVVFERRGPLVREHVQRGFGDGVGVELARHEEGDVGGGEDGGDKDDALQFGFLDEREEGAGDAEGSDGAECHFVRELVKVPELRKIISCLCCFSARDCSSGTFTLRAVAMTKFASSLSYDAY
jgi:hypothetical protein